MNTSAPPDWKSAAYKWLFSQGTSTILLFALVVGMWVGGPKLLIEVKAYINDANRSHEAQVNRMAESFDKDQERDSRLLESILKEKGVGDLPMLGDPHIAAQPQWSKP